MTDMINDLLDLSRARLSSGIPILRTTVDLGALAEAVCEEQRLTAPEVVVQLTTAGSLVGSWDGSRVGQALANLLANAAQHGASGEGVRVRVDGSDVGVATVEVTNGGVIDPDLLPRVFDPFRRGDRAGEGLGLGLFIVREIALAHGGEVKVASAAGSGTTFELVLPR